MEKLLPKENDTSNQEEGFNPMLLRLGSPNRPYDANATTPTDQESPITVYCSRCGSKKTIDPSTSTTLKEVSSSQNEGSHYLHSSSPPPFFHQIPNQSSPHHTSPTDLKSDDDSKHKQIEEGNIIKMNKSSTEELQKENYGNPGFNCPNPTPPPPPPPPPPSPTDQESPIMFSDSCSMCGSKKRKCLAEEEQRKKKTRSLPKTSPPKSLENIAAATPNQKSGASNATYFGTSGSSSSPSFHLPKSSSSSSTMGDHQKQKQQQQKQQQQQQQQVEEGNTSSMKKAFLRMFPKKKDAEGINDLPWDLVNKIASFLPQAQAARLPILCRNLNRMGIFAANPNYIDRRLIKSWKPFVLDIDYARLNRSRTFNSLNGPEKESFIVLFIKVMFNIYKARTLNCTGMSLTGTCKLTTYVLSQRFRCLKTLILFDVHLPTIKAFLCGGIEELELHNCQVPSYFELALDKEEKLKVFSMQMCEGIGRQRISRIILSVPTLLTLKFHGWLSFFDLRGARNLLHADIHFEGKASTVEPLWGSKNLIYELLRDLRNVHTLRLCELCIRNVRQRRSQLIRCLENPFPKLKELFITVSSEEEEEGGVSELACMLKSVPVLVKLDVTIGQTWSTPVGFWKSLENPIKFHNLLYFKIEPFKGRVNEIEFLEHVLINSPMLKKAEVILEYGVLCSSMGEGEQTKLMKALEAAKRLKEDIVALPRASKTAELIVVL